MRKVTCCTCINKWIHSHGTGNKWHIINNGHRSQQKEENECDFDQVVLQCNSSLPEDNDDNH